MGIWQDKRQRGLDMIINALQQIDLYNRTHKDAKNLDKDKLIAEITREFAVTSRTADEWFHDAYKMNLYAHEKSLSLEKIERDAKGYNDAQ